MNNAKNPSSNPSFDSERIKSEIGGGKNELENVIGCDCLRTVRCIKLIIRCVESASAGIRHCSWMQQKAAKRTTGGID
jgi:hypothetical protein